MSDAAETEIDLSTASIARVYDAFLGGKDNFEVDRKVEREVMEIAPEAEKLARACREWLIRVVRYLAAPRPTGAGMVQFLDLGCGLPSQENTHQVAQRANPEATVVYVDTDPAVSAYGRALLETGTRTRFAQTDLRYPDRVLAHPAVAALDWTEPITLMQCCTLHHLEDEDKPQDIMRAYIDALPSGSHVAITHFYDPADRSELADLARQIERRFRGSSMGTSRFRTRAEIESYFCGLPLLPASAGSDAPALGLVEDWWPDGPRQEELRGMDNLILSAVARKP